MSDIEIGNYNGASSKTILGAQSQDPGAPWGNGIGDRGPIFAVSPLGGNDAGISPPQTLDGIVGQGYNGPSMPGGTGVIGKGGPSAGTGVLGQGGATIFFDEIQEVGMGGTGVEGDGGNGYNKGGMQVAPGMGVLGIGGTPDSSQGAGAGVVGIAGG